MAPQHDFILDNQNGAQFRADVNLALEAIATVSSGAVEPTTTYAYQYWADTTTGYLKQRDGSNANWIVRGNLAADYGQAGQVLTSAGAGLPAIWTSITEDGAWTVAQDSTNAHFTFTGNGFDGTEANPDIYLVRGAVYNFTNASTTKGFQVQSTAGLNGTAYNDGITTNPALAPDSSTVSTLVWTVQMDAPSELYYHSTVDAGPGGNIYILDAAGGGSELEWTLTANGTTDYIFAGPGFAGTETDPTIYLVRGQTYKFTNAMGAHPFQIQSTQGTSGTAYSDGITNNAVSNGTLTWEVRMDAPSTLYYQCTSHADMNGTIRVLDVSSTGTVASIDDIGDVDTTTVAPTDGQALVWDAANSQWEPGTVSTSSSGGGGGVTTTTPWAPSDLTLSMWLDADDASTITESGGAVSAWNDKTANAFNVAQATAANQPTLTANGLNGKSVITFDGTNDYLSVPPSIQTQPMTIAVVCKANSTASSGGGTGRAYVFDGMGTNTTGRALLALDAENNGYAGIYAGGTGLWVKDSTATFDTNAHIFVLNFNGGSSSLKFDGGTPATGTLGSLGLTNGVTLGANYNQSADWFNGAIAEFIVLPLATTDDQQKLEGYLAHKWGLEASLPAAHPYKSEAPVNVETTSLPPGTADGEALVWKNGAWNVGPVIGGVDYAQGSTLSTNYTAPTGFSYWSDTFLLRDPANATLSNNDLTATYGSNQTQAYSTQTKSTGKWYWEIRIDGGTDNNSWIGIGTSTNNWVGSTESGGIGVNGSGGIANNSGGSGISSVASHAAGDVRMFALDADAKKLWIGKNGAWDNSGDPAAGTGEVAYGWGAGKDWMFICRIHTSGFGNTIEVTGSIGTQVTIPYSIDKLDDVDTSTIAPTDGQALLWDAANSQWEPGTVSSGGTSLPAAQDGEALIYENGQWVAGPVIGGVDYTTVITAAPTYTVPTGYTFWSETWQIFPSGSTDITLSNNDLTASVTTGGSNVAASSAAKNSGKWYWEIEINSSTNDTFLGIKTTTDGTFPGQNGSSGIGIRQNGSIFNNNVAGVNSSSVVSYADSDIVMFALDMDNGEVYMGKNGTWAGSSDPSTATAPFASSLAAGSYYFIGRGAIAGEEFTINKVSSSTQTTIPYSIDKLDDVDTSTVAPTNGQVLTWDGSQWEPATPTTSGLPVAQDGEALIYENGQWVAGPVIGGVDYTSSGDSDFSSVSLLLLGNGTNASTTFTDSSSNSLSVTANGAAEISTTQSKFGGSSIHLPASSQGWLSIADNTLLNLSNDFTVEAWIYITSNSAQYQTIIGSATSSWSSGAVHLYVQNGVLRMGGNTFPSTLTGTASIANNTWYHVAVTRSGTDVKLFVDGVVDATQTNSAVFSFNDNGTFIGKNGWDGSSTRFSGYIDDLRVTKGVARYTAAFTPPTAELPASVTTVTIPYSIDKLDDVDTSTVAPTDGQVLVWDATNSQWEPGTVSGGGTGTAGDSYYNNVEVLLHFDGTDGSTTFTDHSKNAWTVTANNQAQISTTESKFGGSSLYSGSSTSFNAAVIADDPALTLDADFTIEAWIYNQSTPASGGFTTILSKWNNGGEYNILVRDDNSISFGWGVYNANSLNNPLLRSSASSIAANTWTHIAITRSGNGFRMYIGGSQVDTATNSTTVTNTSNPLHVGAFSASDARRFDGYIDDVRITKGLARYTSGFTVPAAAFPNTQAAPTSINDNDDVDTSTVAPTDGQALVWDATNSKWEPGGGGGISRAQATAITLVFS